MSEEPEQEGGIIRGLEDMRRSVPTFGVLAAIFGGMFSGGALIAACIVWVYSSIQHNVSILEAEVAERVQAEQDARDKMEKRLSNEIDQTEARIMERLTSEVGLLRSDLRDLRQTVHAQGDTR